jgi:hypothetical protein
MPYKELGRWNRRIGCYRGRQNKKNRKYDGGIGGTERVIMEEYVGWWNRTEYDEGQVEHNLS